MSLFDALLNVAALMLWLLWREAGFLDRSRLAPMGLLSTLRPAQALAKRNFHLLLGMGALLLVRAVFYWHIGRELNWLPQIHLIALTLSFRSEHLACMLAYSGLSFLWLAGTFYLWLFLLSALHGNLAEKDSYQKRLRMHLGWLGRWPAWLKLGTPLLAGAASWLIIHPLLVTLRLIPAAVSWSQLGGQALVVGFSAFFSWKGLILALLLLHMLNSYVFLGNFDFWSFVNTSALRLLRPLAIIPLRLGRIDLAPVVGIVLVVLLTEIGARQLNRLFDQWPV